MVADENSEVKTQEKIHMTDSSSADGKHKSKKGHLSPIQSPNTMNMVAKKKTQEGIDKAASSPANRNKKSKKGHLSPIQRPHIMNLSDTADLTVLTPVVGRKVEILKSIVYGGLIESITSLGVISSAAGSGASTLNILVFGLANLFGGLILIIQNLQELREEEPRKTSIEDNQTNRQEVEGRYKRVLGQRENFAIHASVAILSFIIMGLLPPVVYYFSFSKTHNKNYKVASVFGSSLLCIALLAIAKAHVKTPRGSYLKSVLYYMMIAAPVSGVSYVVGVFVNQLLEKYGWSDGSEASSGDMMLSLFGRKAGSFGDASLY